MTTLIYIYLIGAVIMAGAVMGAMINDKAEGSAISLLLFILMIGLLWPVILISAFFVKEK